MLKSTKSRWIGVASAVVLALVAGGFWPFAFIVYGVVVFLVGLATFGAAVYDWTQRGGEDLEASRRLQNAAKAR